MPTSSVISSDLTGKLSPLLSILEETLVVSTPAVIASEPTIVDLKYTI